MKRVPVGQTELSLSVMSLGTMTFGNEADEAMSCRLLDAYVDAGGNVIDTADRYSMGVSEEIIGRWLKKSGRRDSVVVASKARFPMARGSGLHPNYLRGAIEDNLMRLDIDTLDIFQPHAFDPMVHPAEWLGLMGELIDEGKVRYLGVSNFLGYQLQQTLDVAQYEKLPVLVSLQAQYNLLDRQIEIEILEVCRRHNIPLLAWSPLAGGWLTGKYRRGEEPAGQSRLGENSGRFLESFEKRGVDSTYAILDEVEAVARELSASMAQVSLAWLSQHPEVASIVLGARSMAQLSDNLGALDIILTGEQWSRLDLVSRPAVPDYPYSFMDLMGGR